MKIITYSFLQDTEVFLLQLDNKQVFHIPYSVFEKYSLSKNLELSNEMYNILYEYEKYFQAKSAALSYLSYGLKSSKEVKDYLAKKKYSTSIQEKVVEQFIKTGLIDDLYYAKAFTRDKLKLNHYGPIRIQMELKKKGIDEAFIDETLKEVSKEILIETAYEASIKKIHSLKNKSNFQKKQKIYQFLSYKGFDYDTIMSAWSKLQENADV
ncbi:regulatory protein RecX [Peptostreptococcaceae bacterium oral taxon 113 str. W5053]|nr:regulatory protein RecX [Peptostreptococcaceae bacterium oral taxon 113 str. W5053]